ncbi:hypothetical protein PR202_ga23065 [Eleusine coracana subsp. coracana]|uniref:Uncharacterized protein n=1 Tax=Eleusine coracana subsp. coracana TaxID=191504 RepID=A0AAV5D5U3_ELECO|nr:hypothetical protein PR202_ga23065 [Eleusine coracana subsp. coracana]
MFQVHDNIWTIFSSCGWMSSSGPLSPPTTGGGRMASHGSSSASIDGMLRSRGPLPPCTSVAPAALVGMSSSSKSGGLLRSNVMAGSRKEVDQEME